LDPKFILLGSLTLIEYEFFIDVLAYLYDDEIQLDQVKKTFEEFNSFLESIKYF